VAGSLALRELSEAATTRLALARPGDDDELRALLRRSVVPGDVRVAFTREPNYFAGEGLAGAKEVTVVARRDGRLVGMGHCSVHTLFRNGTVHRIGYLGQLRLAPGTPASTRMLRDGYAFLADAVGASVDGFFTSITVDNDRARRVLERGRSFGLPAYRPVAALVTLVAPVPPASRPDNEAEVSCTEGERGELTTFLRRQAQDAHLTLAWNAAQWEALARGGITTRDFRVIRRGGRIVAAAAVWDQRSFRQTVIDGYGPALHTARPLLNAVQAMRRRPRLPTPGSVLAQGALLGTGVVDAADWLPLWRALQHKAGTMGLSWLLLSRDARDPHLPRLRRLLQAREYRTTVYDVVWAGRPGWSEDWDRRVFRPEAGLL
jgi:hypothetical protein